MVTIELIEARLETIFIVSYTGEYVVQSRIYNSRELVEYLRRLGNTSIPIRVI